MIPFNGGKTVSEVRCHCVVFDSVYFEECCDHLMRKNYLEIMCDLMRRVACNEQTEWAQGMPGRADCLLRK